MNIPPVFADNVCAAFGDAGRHYLASLPDLLKAASKRWELTLGEPFLLSYNFVCAATREDGSPAVLKIGVPNLELTSEINTLRVYAGQGACCLYEADPEAGMLLLERLSPGSMLAALTDDDRATEIAADVMKCIHRPVPAGDGFLSLHGWFGELMNLRPRFGGGTGPFPEKMVELVDGMLRELFAEQRSQVLLHGDFHHYNILLSERGWQVIDPKGVVGVPEFDAGPLLINPLGKISNEAKAIHRTQRRIAILSERLGFDRQRLWRWAVCFSLLSDWWTVSADGSGGEDICAWTDILLRTRI